ncbi:MAG TPA: TolC family protein [Bryobacteraceae bacterium]|nr:TolC family protein [Bryobacteraceae bacterium]
MKRNRVLPLCLGALCMAMPAVPQDGTAITLEDFIRASLARNREVLALRQRVVQAEGLARQAGVRPAPTVEAEGGGGRPVGNAGDTQFSAAFVQPVETFGKRKSRLSVAEASVALAKAEVQERSLQLAYEIETGYLSMDYERERIAVFERLSESLRESRRLTDARVREGDAAPLEAQLLAVEQSRADAQRGDAAGRLAVAELQLRRLAGLTPAETLPAIVPRTADKPLPFEQLIARAKEKRADLRSARLLEQQGGAEIALTKAQARPDVTFSARYGHSNSRLGNQYGFTAAGVLTPLKDQFNTLSVGISVPLLTQRRSQGAIEAAAAGAAGARLQREYVEQSIPLEVQSAFERWSAAVRTRNVLHDDVLGQSNKNLAVIREAYHLGQLRLLDVLTEQRRLTDTELSYLDARAAADRAWTDLERATGGLLP